MRIAWQGLLAALVALIVAAPSAQAAFGIAKFDAQVHELDGPDAPHYYEQAGGHPDIGFTDFTFNSTGGVPDGAVKDIRVDVPAGLISNPQALPQCTDAQLTSVTGCPPNTQLGTEELTVVPLLGVPVDLKLPLYNMTFGPDQVSRFSFFVPLINERVDIIGGVRSTTDHGLFFTISDVDDTIPVLRSNLTFWGVPWDDRHNAERGQSCVPLCTPGGQDVPGTGTPFLTNPTWCAGVKLTTRLTVVSHAGETATATTQTPTADNGTEGPQNCAAVPFSAGIGLSPDTTQRDTPAGVDVNLHVPPAGLLVPGQIAPSHVRNVEVTLPPGMTMNPSAANGLEACTDEQLAKGTTAPVTCPEASKLGTVSVTTPLLPNPLTGSIYLGQPLPGDRYRLFLTADAHGVSLRLKGSVRPDPQTGRVTAIFTDNPQAPFSDFTLRFRGGPRAPVATPLDCGEAATSAVFSPYSGNAPATPSSSFSVDGGCGPAPFGPGLGAALDNRLAGASSPFTVSIGRNDGHQYLSGVSVELPPGLIGMISRVAQCPDAQAAVGACPEASRVGTASVRSGAGSEPYALSGPVYFTGPYKGAPFGLVVVIRAIAGPFDLGTVVVRQAIHVDPVDAHLRVVSDPLPTILEGIPLRLRAIDVRIDRQGFMLNPTACGPKQTRASFASTAGAGAGGEASFSIEACERLPLSPKIALRTTGRRRTATGAHPGLRAVVTQASGQANIRRASVTLPLTLALDPANARGLCSFEDGLAARCPKASIIGHAKAISPALNRPLTGPVHFVQGIRIDPRTGRRIRTLPTLLAVLQGEVTIHLRATTAVARNRLVSTFEPVPDAPVSRFELTLNGGKGGILVVTRNRNLCRGRQRAAAAFAGHNGKQLNNTVRLRTPCRAPRLRLGQTQRTGSQLTVKGRIARAARGRIRITVRCGSARMSKATRVRRGRWQTSVRLKDRCANRRLRLTARYRGGPGFKPATKKRALRG